MQKIVFVLLTVCFAFVAIAQKNPVISAPGYDISLTFEGYDGTNSCAVAWSPDRQLYYAVFAGNVDYPLETFSANGENLDAGTIGVDNRGIWYNPATRQLEGMSFDGGHFKTVLDYSGIPQSPVYMNEQAVSGGEQTVWQFNAATGETYKYVEGAIYVYTKGKFKMKSPIWVTGLPCDLDNLNFTSMIYTGQKNYEFGLLDVYNYQVHLLNKKGQYTASINLSEEPLLSEAFCFAFANDRVWLYDKEARTWYGHVAFY